MASHSVINLVSPGPDRGPRDRVAGEAGVDVELDTGVAACVQPGPGGSAGEADATASSDFDVEALWVGLGSVVICYYTVHCLVIVAIPYFLGFAQW